MRGQAGADTCLIDQGDDAIGCEQLSAVPAAPTGLTGDPTSSRIDLEWDPSAGAIEYLVYRDGLGIASVSTTSFRDDDLEPSTAYTYRVAAGNDAGYSRRSDPLHIETRPASNSGLTVKAAGDIACDPSDPSYNGGNGTASKCRHRHTAELLDGADQVLALGDTQYDCGGLAAFLQSYDPTWGIYKDITHPILSDEDFGNGGTDCGAKGPDGYFDYWGAAGGPEPHGYHSWNAGGWHFIALNSECDDVPGGCGEGSPQNDWLEQDLAANNAECTMALLHEPRFRSKRNGDQVSSTMKPFWDDLAPAGVEMILSGDSHFYERFRPQDASGAHDPSGMVQWVVGLGGKSRGGLAPSSARLPNSAKATSSTFGVLELTLRRGSYEWDFLAEGNSGFQDSGSAACH